MLYDKILVLNTILVMRGRMSHAISSELKQISLINIHFKSIIINHLIWRKRNIVLEMGNYFVSMMMGD